MPTNGSGVVHVVGGGGDVGGAGLGCAVSANGWSGGNQLPFTQTQVAAGWIDAQPTGVTAGGGGGGGGTAPGGTQLPPRQTQVGEGWMAEQVEPSPVGGGTGGSAGGSGAASGWSRGTQMLPLTHSQSSPGGTPAQTPGTTTGSSSSEVVSTNGTGSSK